MAESMVPLISDPLTSNRGYYPILTIDHLNSTLRR
jgi:hypothetical protein